MVLRDGKKVELIRLFGCSGKRENGVQDDCQVLRLAEWWCPSLREGASLRRSTFEEGDELLFEHLESDRPVGDQGGSIQ